MRIASAVLCFFTIFSVAAASAAPAEEYLAARDQGLAEICALKDDGSQERAYGHVSGTLETLLHATVPDWKTDGFPVRGQFTIQVPCQTGYGYGVLDGWSYRSQDTSVIVTSVPLLKRWLFDHHNWDPANPLAGIPAAFRSDVFYTQALDTDAAAQLRGQVLVKTPAGTDLAMAQLAVFAQYEATDRDPDTLLVVVLRGDRVFIAKQRLTVTVERPAICKKIVDPILAQSASALKEYQDSLKGTSPGRVKDSSRFDAHIALEEKAGRAYQTCFARHMTELPNYGLVQKQAQSLVDLLH